MPIGVMFAPTVEIIPTKGIIPDIEIAKDEKRLIYTGLEVDVKPGVYLYTIALGLGVMNSKRYKEMQGTNIREIKISDEAQHNIGGAGTPNTTQN